MAPKAIVFACANPVPEIWPVAAHQAGATIVATGRSDFPNQVNNSLVFPGLFRGVLDVRAQKITDGMTLAAMQALAASAEPQGLSPQRILPSMHDRKLPVTLAIATGLAAEREGVAIRQWPAEKIRAAAEFAINQSRDTVARLAGHRQIPSEIQHLPEASSVRN